MDLSENKQKQIQDLGETVSKCITMFTQENPDIVITGFQVQGYDGMDPILSVNYRTRISRGFNVTMDPEPPYTRPVDHTKDYILSVDEFNREVLLGYLTDYDGWGHPVKNGMASKTVIRPSIKHHIPLDATHIVWYNK